MANGLLDFLQTPAGTGLLSAVAGGMAGARRGTPWNNAGRAGLAGLTGYAQAQDDILRKQEQDYQKQFRQMQMDKMQSDLATAQAAKEWKTGLPGMLEQSRPKVEGFKPDTFDETDNPFGQMANVTPGNPQALQDYMMKAESPFADKILEKQLFPKEVTPQLVTVQTPNGPIQRWVKPGENAGVDVGAPVDKESALPWYVKKGQNGLAIDPAYAEFEKTKAAYGRPPAQPMAPVAYMNDKGQTVWGTITDARGRPAANYSPALQGQIAQAKEVGKVTGEEQTKATFDAPKIIDNGEASIRLSNELLKHPGFSSAVGATLMPGARLVEGTKEADFMNRLDQLKGGAFLEAYNTLKGGGQITEVEGKKATAAIARMDKAQSENEFKAAVKDYQDVIRKGVNRAKMKAKSVGPVQPPAQGGAKFLGFE